MAKVCEIILNFADETETPALWRLCASSRSGEPPQCFSWFSSAKGECQPFQENVNQTRNAVNDVSTTVNLFSKKTVNDIRKRIKKCQPKSGKDKENGHYGHLVIGH